jgi:hypothetical protein
VAADGAASTQVVLNKIFGYLPGRIASFVMNLHTSPKTIYLSRHGQSEYNLTQKIGGDSGLTDHGREYAAALADWVHTNVLDKSPTARLWTSTLRRTIETSALIKHDEVRVDGKSWIMMRPRQWHALDEIHAGIFDGQFQPTPLWPVARASNVPAPFTRILRTSLETLSLSDAALSSRAGRRVCAAAAEPPFSEQPLRRESLKATRNARQA